MSATRAHLTTVALRVALLGVVAGFAGTLNTAQAQRRATTPPPEPRTYAGLSLELTGRGTAIGALATYRLAGALTAFGELRYSGVEYPQVKCLAVAADTVALLDGSQYYLGDRHYVSNLIARERGEALVGVRLAGGGRFKFLASLAGGYRVQDVRSEVEGFAQGRSIFGCGNLGVDPERASGPVELQQPEVFESRAGSGVAALGVGVEVAWRRGVRTSVQLVSRHYFYGDARFRVRDPRQPGNGSAVLRLRDHAADDELRLRASVLVPLRKR